jgi:hypothetical protein
VSTALEKAHHTLASLRKSQKAERPMEALGGFVGGAVLGSLRKHGILPTTVAGMPSTPVAAAVTFLVASAIPKAYRGVAYGAASGMLGAYGFNAAVNGTLIAGDAEDGMLGLTG